MCIGHCDAALGPVEQALDTRISAADSVYANVASKGGILGRYSVVSQGLHDTVESVAADQSIVIGAFGIISIGVVEAKK